MSFFLFLFTFGYFHILTCIIIISEKMR
jgi:hypothetical protein